MTSNPKIPLYINQGAPEALKFYGGNRKQDLNHYDDIGNFNQNNSNSPYVDFPLLTPNWEEEAFLREFNKKLWKGNQPFPISQGEAEEFRKNNVVEIIGEQIPLPVLDIDKFKIPQFLIDNFKSEFTTPTTVQSECWPTMMHGRDLVVQSPTGTGKTMAFLLPTIAHILEQPKLPYGHGPLALILTPSRELADQIHQLVPKLMNGATHRFRKINILTLVGGTTKRVQIDSLERGVDLLVASPGRLYDMLVSSATHLKHTSLIVLDEGDKLLLTMRKELDIIFSQLNPDCQKALFTATATSPNIQKVIKMMQDPIQIFIGKSTPLLATQAVKQSFELVTEGEKLDKLVKKFKDFVPKIDGRYQRAIVFCRDRLSVEETSAHLLHNGLDPIAFHSEFSQKERNWVLEQFHQNKSSLLVTSYLVARGIDFKHINYILIKDPPRSLTEHAHMVGRTGRGNTEGYCHTFLTIGDQFLILKLAKAMKGNELSEDPVLLEIANRYENIEQIKKRKKQKNKNKKNKQYDEFDSPMFQRMD